MGDVTEKRAKQIKKVSSNPADDTRTQNALQGFKKV